MEMETFSEFRGLELGNQDRDIELFERLPFLMLTPAFTGACLTTRGNDFEHFFDIFQDIAKTINKVQESTPEDLDTVAVHLQLLWLAMQPSSELVADVADGVNFVKNMSRGWALEAIHDFYFEDHGLAID